MQRKNNLLKTSHSSSSRKGMAMIMAIAVIVVLATLMTLSLSLATQTTKKTTDLYLYEKSVLVSQSAADYALLRISQVAPCSIDQIDFRYNETYDVNISIRYIFTDPSTCKTNSDADGSNYATVIHPASNGSAIMDISVIANPTGTTEPIRYFRRSIQKL